MRAAEYKEAILDWAGRDEYSLQYATSHITRLIRTTEIVPPGESSDAVLELGVYFHITPLLKELLGYGTVQGAYFSEDIRSEDKEVRAVSKKSFRARVDLFDLERHVFPYRDGQFDTVLCCEILEHLKNDPMHMMSEINRILSDEGHLILTTPNIASWDSLSAMVAGNNPGFFPHYIRPQAGGESEPKHSREYTPSEIRSLVSDAGFEPLLMETGSYGSAESEPSSRLLSLVQELGGDTSLRQACIYCVARKRGAVVSRFPPWLYA